MRLRKLDSKLPALTLPSTTALLLLGVASLAACSEATTYDGHQPTDSGTADQDTGRDSNDTGPDQSSATWLSLSASVMVVAGAILSEKTRLDWTILDQEEESLCVMEIPVNASTVEDPLPDLSLTTAWNLDTGRGTGDCGLSANGIPSDFGLAFGELLPDLAAVLGDHGFDGLDHDLWGVYMSADDWESLVAFGAAATAEGWKGEVEADTGTALPDGLYQVVSLYALPF
jgi:hypothetical protein